MKLGTKLFLLVFAVGSWTTILTVLAVGAVYFWPVPTAQSLCGDTVCVGELGENYVYLEADANIGSPDYRKKDTAFGLWEYGPEDELRVTLQGTMMYLTRRGLGPHALVAAVYVAVNSNDSGVYPTPQLRYPTVEGEMRIEINEAPQVFLYFRRPFEEVPVRNEPAASAFDHHRAVD